MKISLFFLLSFAGCLECCLLAEIWIGNSICGCVNAAFLYPLLASEADSFSAAYQKVVEEVFSKRSGGLEFKKSAFGNSFHVQLDKSDSENILGVDFGRIPFAKSCALVMRSSVFAFGMSVIAALMAESKGAFCEALLARDCIPLPTDESVASTRRFVKEFFVKHESIARIATLFTDSEQPFSQFELVPNMDLLSLFSQSNEAFEKSMLWHLMDQLYNRYLGVYVSCWNSWMQIVEPKERGMWNEFVNVLAAAVPSRKLVQVYRQIQWNPFQKEEIALERYIEFLQNEIPNLAFQVKHLHTKEAIQKAFASDLEEITELDADSFILSFGINCESCGISGNSILFAATKSDIPIERFIQLFAESLPFSGNNANVFAFWLQFLELLPVFEREEENYLNPHIFVADRIAAIEAALDELKELFSLAQMLYEKPWLGLCEENEWISTQELRQNAFRMLFSARLVKKLFPQSAQELVYCLHSKKSKHLLLNLLLSSEEKLDRIPNEANEAFSLMVEEVFCERILNFIHSQIGTSAKALNDVANGTFYSFQNDLHQFFEQVLVNFLHISLDSDEYTTCFYHTWISIEQHAQITQLLSTKDAMQTLLEEMRKKSLLQQLLKSLSPSFHRIVHYSVARRMMVCCFGEDLDLWTSALWIWNVFYIDGKPFIALFDEWSCIHQVQDAFKAELLKSRLQVGDFLQKMKQLFVQVRQKDEIFRLILQAACYIGSQRQKPPSSWRNWLKRSSNQSAGIHSNSQLMNPIDFVIFCQTESMHVPFARAIENKLNPVIDKSSEGQVLFSLAFLRTNAGKNSIHTSAPARPPPPIN